jgi:protocatechuate 3,4-dioxygenase, beta subunit
MRIRPINRRIVVLGGVALGATGAGYASPPPVRPDLYKGETDPAALEWKGRVEDIPARIRLAPKNEPGEAMSISGRCLSWETGKPVAGVIVYAYHTDTTGVYSGGSSETVWSRRHGSRRGWMRTGADGVYAFDSVKPGVYPSRTEAAHIHMTVVEAGKPPYWIDDIVFDGEYKVDKVYRTSRPDRGGNGIIALKRVSGVWTGVRDIQLERHPA